MIGSFEAALVERHAETQPAPAIPQVGCRTLCQHPGCGRPIELVPPMPPDDQPVWAHVLVGTWVGPAHQATPVEPAQHPVEIECPGLGCRARAWRMPDGKVYCENIGAVMPDEDGQEPAGVLPRQALTHPSSLVDALLDAAAHHGKEAVQSAEVYRAAEQAAALLQQILMPKQPEGGEPR